MTKYYFLGIGGIGMSAIARYFNCKGYKVGGYDRVCSQLCLDLQKEGIDIHYTDLKDNIPTDFTDPHETIVIYTPAIPSEHGEFEYFKRHGFKILKRAEVLGEITKSERGLCVAGTHGKTTISTMIAHLLRQSHVDCNAFLGGISINYNSNLLLSDKSDLVVIEADEYDRSFHKLSPTMAVISSTDADHLDIYGSHSEYIEAFEHFCSLIVDGGTLLYKKGIQLNPKLKPSVKSYQYSVNEKSDFYADNIRVGDGRLLFDAVMLGTRLSDIQLGVPVFVNVENAVAAMAIAWLNGVDEDELRKGMASYRGVKRRFEKHLEQPKIYIDDYAHHPKELASSISSLKMLYADKKILGVFQPHLYSRTADFYHEFAEALSQLDEVVLLEIYPAREKPIEGVSSALIYNEITSTHKSLTTKELLFETLKDKDFDVIVTFGAGDIDRYIPQIKDFLKTNY